MSLGVYRLDDYTTTTNSESEQALLDGFAGMLEDGGLTVTVVPEIQRVKYAKNFWNVAFSSIGGFSAYPLAIRPSGMQTPPAPASKIAGGHEPCSHAKNKNRPAHLSQTHRTLP